MSSFDVIQGKHATQLFMQGAEKSVKDSLQSIYSFYIKFFGLFNPLALKMEFK